MERFALAEFLEDLVAGGEFDGAVGVEGEGRLERRRRDDLDAAVLGSLLGLVDEVDVVDGVSELVFSGGEHGHLFDLLQVFVGIPGLNQRVLDGLIQQLLLFSLHLLVLLRGPLSLVLWSARF
jgi:hypothetical protein